MDTGTIAVSFLERLDFCAMAKAKRTKIYPRCVALLLCDALFIDPNSSKPNLFGVFDNFRVRELPSGIRFSVFVKLCGGDGAYPIQIALIDQDGKAIDSALMDIDDFSIKPKQNIKIGGTFTAEIIKRGAYKLVVRSGTHVICESGPILVELLKK